MRKKSRISVATSIAFLALVQASQVSAAGDKWCIQVARGLQVRAHQLVERAEGLFAGQSPIKYAPSFDENPVPDIEPAFAEVVVPVIGEIKKGSLFRLLDWFSGQSDMRFRLNIVVNNRPESALKKDDTFQQNQQTLQLLRYISGELDTRPNFLSALPFWQQAAVDQARRKGIKIRVLDLSTVGFERNIGKIRNVGVQRVIIDALASQSNPAIVWMDADTVGPEDFIARVLGNFKNRNIEAQFIQIEFDILEGSDSLQDYKNLYLYRLSHTWNEFRKLILPNLSPNPLSIGGPQIIATARAFQAIGGVPPVEIHEDARTWEKLFERGSYLYPENITVFTADRRKADGYGAALKREDTSTYDIRNLWFFGYFRRMTFLANAQDYFLRTPYSVDHARKIAEFYGFQYPVDPEFVPNFDPIKVKESVKIISSVAQEYRDDPDLEFMELMLMHVEVEEIARIGQQIKVEENRYEDRRRSYLAMFQKIADNIRRQKPFTEGITDEPSIIFVQQNAWVESFVRKGVEASQDADAFETWLSRQLPNYIKPFAETPYARTNATLRVFIRAALEANNNPETFPSLAAMLKKIRDPQVIVDGAR